jgi:ankyrin repeat protein
LIAALFGLGIVPEGFWQRLFIRQMARSPHASDLLATAGCNGDVKTIESYLTHGVPVNATSRGDRKNALHCASFLGHLDAIRYLASHGASLDTLDRAGDSALEMAASNGQEAAVKLLQQLGAHRVRGTGEQREKAIQDQVSEQIAEDEKRMQEILKQ